MNARFAKTDEIKHWNSHILKNPDNGNIFQGYEFAEQKKLSGWLFRYVIVDNIAILILEKHITLMGKLWYIPKGPGVNSTEQLSKLLVILHRFALKNAVFTIKIEPEIQLGSNLNNLNITATRPIQPNFSTVLMNINPDIDTILSNLPQKGRHAIRRAKRDGVIVKKVVSSDRNCRIMYDLLYETAQDAKFGVRSFNYYREYWQRYETADIGQLFFAFYKGKVIAGAYVLAFGIKGTYKDGASIRQKTAYGASHLLQWHAIKWLKTKGVSIYDLCGAPPIDQIKNTNHPHYGIGLFKTSLSKNITQYIGAYEVPVKNLRSKLWTKYIEKIVRRIHYKIKHESYY